jgi:Activator of Hsp90 ATPase homolog 1-like protein
LRAGIANLATTFGETLQAKVFLAIVGLTSREQVIAPDQFDVSSPTGPNESKARPRCTARNTNSGCGSDSICSADARAADDDLACPERARNVKADPRRGGVLRLVDFGGFWVEGTYLKVIPHRKAVFSWGGIEGLKSGQSIVEFTLHSNGRSTLLRLCHFGLSLPAVKAHRFIWKKSGLPKLKAVAEGKEPSGTCLGDAADSREQCPYSASVACEN